MDRRKFLTTAGSAVAIAVAGCTGSDSPSSEPVVDGMFAVSESETFEAEEGDEIIAEAEGPPEPTNELEFTITGEQSGEVVIDAVVDDEDDFSAEAVETEEYTFQALAEGSSTVTIYVE